MAEFLEDRCDILRLDKLKLSYISETYFLIYTASTFGKNSKKYDNSHSSPAKMTGFARCKCW